MSGLANPTGRMATDEEERHFSTALRRFGDAFELLDRMKRWETKPSVASSMAEHFDAKHDYVKAEGWYRRRAELEPESTVGTILLSVFLARRGRLEEAKDVQLRATHLEGDPDEAWFNHGLILRAQGKFAEAAKSVREAIRIDPRYPDYVAIPSWRTSSVRCECRRLRIPTMSSIKRGGLVAGCRALGVASARSVCHQSKFIGRGGSEL